MTSLRQNTRFLSSGLERLANLIGFTLALKARQTFHTRCQMRRPSLGRPSIQQDFCRLPNVIHVRAHTDFQPDTDGTRKPAAICHAGECGRRGGVA